MNLRLRDENEHPSRFSLQQLHLGELSGPHKDQLEDHVSQCSHCQAELGALQLAKNDFHENHPASSFLAQIEARASEPDTKKTAWWTVLLRPGTALTVGAVMLLVVVGLVFGPWMGPEDDGVRVKGQSLELSYLVERDGRPVLANPGQVLHPGQRIQFRLSAPKGGYVHLIGIDQAGQVTVYYPGPGQAAEAYPGGMGRPVPGSVILDDTLGRERVFALICDAPLDRAALSAQVSSLNADPRVWIDRPELPVDCRQTSLLLLKE